MSVTTDKEEVLLYVLIALHFIALQVKVVVHLN